MGWLYLFSWCIVDNVLIMSCTFVKSAYNWFDELRVHVPLLKIKWPVEANIFFIFSHHQNTLLEKMLTCEFILCYIANVANH